ncbi:putative rna-directed dna polymerase from transposon bs [Trichonephila clavipes]|nr:putative rna-directed dna polymerase from transposon bs [Trichonephila clavipes]
MKLIEFGKSRESIALQRIPSHCNISGNEKADRLAKTGSLMSQPDSPFPLRNIKRLIYSKLQINRVSQYSDAAAGKMWSILLNKSGRIPCSQHRFVGVAYFRLLTGYDYFQMYLHRFGVKDSACCPLGNQGEMEGDHLRHCPIVLKFFVDNPMEANFNSFFASSLLYWAACRLMAEMPKMGVR